jgi:hypothetical protein
VGNFGSFLDEPEAHDDSDVLALKSIDSILIIRPGKTIANDIF